MSKKSKPPKDPSNANDSSDSGDENQNVVECIHINKAVDLQRVRKFITKTGFHTECEECTKQPLDPDLADLELDQSLWLCLKCGNQGCSRGKCQHALAHNATPHSDSHALCVNTTIWSVWCYDCDNEVNVTCKKKLLETVEYLRKHAESNRSKQAPIPMITEKLMDEGITLPSKPNSSTGAFPKVPLAGLNSLPRARGLTNLGNTCFFNSVMQCLGQTPYLVQLLDESACAQQFQLSGGIIKIKDKAEIPVPSLEGETETWKPLTQALAETLHELQSGRAEVYNPRHLLQKLTWKLPQFGGGEQHDSHELLRHLLAAVQEEDQKRFKAVILGKLGLRKSDPSTVDDEQKQIVKFYGQQVSERLQATEQVFRGVLVSILQCQTCYHLSHREEKFLDLSLPISEKQVAPVLWRKAEDNEGNKPSKYQMKKEKRAERKKKKQKHYKNNNLLIMNVDNGDNNTDVQMENKSDTEESDADVEDNVEDSCNNIVIALPAPGEDFSTKGGESGYNSDKVENSSPDSNRINSPSEANVDDSGVPSPAAVNNIPNSLNNSPASSETNVDMGSPLLGSTSPDDEYQNQNGAYTRAVSRLAFAEKTDLKTDLRKLSLLNDGDNKVNQVFEQPEDGACAMETSSDMMEQDEDFCDDATSYESTLAPRYQCEENECSVESCLNQFTECELMMGSNKVGCDRCTKRSGNKKTVCTDTSKQLLIFNPPAVLILHLKRFQVFHYRSAKVSKFVKFSTLLDLGPFCSKRSQNLPSIQEGQTKVLYSLYGVVEHSGGIHGGHYVSYIKVRPPLEENHPRWNFIPNKQKKQMIQNLNESNKEPELTSGKWYYVSDSYVSEVAESKVLSAQAYLLFYERLV
ncbi:ubiquitin carboxyl-terminal hydrolase 16/45 [Euwallacea similis]|uniref:ubiquitin carboxyl-terminal hydrolase 16/45 n=1 Tax=Euwallacea similis TaxID=1736056 RepID=UPI00344CDBDB